MLRGVQEGTRRARGGALSHFLLAVVERVNLQADERPRRFYTFCKVGSGYKDAELIELRERLHDKWRPFDRRRPPAWLQGWRPEPDDVPDMVIEPRDSILVEVKCYEIIACLASKFLAEFTCRFPRVVRFRYSDKAWYEADSIDDIRQLAHKDRVKGRKLDDAASPAKLLDTSPPLSPLSDAEDGNGASSQLDGEWGLAGQLAASQEALSDAQGGKKAGRKRGRRQDTADASSQALDAAADGATSKVGQRAGTAAGSVLPLFQAASGLSAVERRSNVLSGWSVVVMVQPECRPSKAELERLVAQHGGEVRQNPPSHSEQSSAPAASRLRCVLLSDGRSSYKLQAHRRSGRFDIVHFDWLLQCAERGRLLRFGHEQVVSATAATASERSRQVDRYGDEYAEPLQSALDTRLVVQAARRSLHSAQPQLPNPAALADGTGDSNRRQATRASQRASSVKQPPPSSSAPPAASATAAASSSRPAMCAAPSESDRVAAGLRERLFDGVRAVLRGADESSSESLEADILRCALALHGAELDGADPATSGRDAPPPTHCIQLSTRRAVERDDERQQQQQHQPLQVTPAWVIDSVRSGRQQNEAHYLPPLIDAAQTYSLSCRTSSVSHLHDARL